MKQGQRRMMGGGIVLVAVAIEVVVQQVVGVDNKKINLFFYI
jgi:hypothetical protein